MYLSFKHLVSINCLLMTGLLNADSLGDFQNRDWKRIKDKDGIQVFRSHNDESQFKTFKSTFVMPMDNIFAFLALMEDYEGAKNWLHMVSTVEAVGETSESTRKVYTATKLPWPVKSRDVYTDVVITQTEDYGLHLLFEESNSPGPENPDYIRVKDTFGYFSVVPIAGTKDVTVTYASMLDPEGFVPAWAVNLITGDVAYYTAQRMERMLQQEKYQDAHYETFKRRPWVVSN